MKSFGKRVACLLGTVLVLGACEGSNLFEEAGRGGLGSDLSIDVTGPATANRGDSVTVAILAQAAAGLQFVRITASGAITRDTTITTTADVYAVNMRFPTVVGGDTVLVVSGIARDQLGRDTGRDSVRVRLF
ncbi:MAG TPA: hypothetical protein VFO52_13820 [Longimicrobiales bacterium]|nr:hypothetical protein [Longimicrobiales bacterium]